MNYSNGRMWDEYDKAMSRITDPEEELEKANARAEAAESTLDEVYVLTTRELAEPCGKETDTLVKIASTIEAIRLGARDALKGGEE